MLARKRQGHPQSGFTIVELMVNLTMVAILFTIALSVYDHYRKRAYEAAAIHYMRSWVPAQELYLQTFGHYADADEQLQTDLGVVRVPTNIPYTFSIDSTSQETERWWGRGHPRQSGLRYFYIDETGVVLSSLSGPPTPP
ncbi:MAG: hypothetical protein KatS3mg076_0580 [Candidatus Binatia bacterium]|nr:MAG: hypothetical protein KatS3mg076_0580 [Candidatus Binatia bacterium]